ncbi:MAG: cyclic nucleotide-binding domain-containing protein, partial [Pseudolabrys sp.]
MASQNQSIIEARREQAFPTLELSEIERMRRFGTLRSYKSGDILAQAGKVSEGFTVILSGKVAVARHASSGQGPLIVRHVAGSFLGELAQLAGRPALVDAHAEGPVETLVIPPDRLRALMIAEAELGERIMRALIIRRIGLLEEGSGGPVIIGHSESSDVLRLAGFLRRNGHPHQKLDPENDSEARALIERFHIDPGQLPIVLCP